MKIPFSRITKNPLSFKVESKKMVMQGELIYKSYALAHLKATLEGSLELVCDSCGEHFSRDFSETLELGLSDGVYHQNNETLEEIIEIESSIVDMDELLLSEIELIKSDYHQCDNCLHTTKEN